jgi:SAM-dependent methyltransferase
MASSTSGTRVAHLCPTCHERVEKFAPGGPRRRPNAKCPNCGALERHRFLAVLLDGLAPILAHTAEVLDIAPSRYTTRHLDHLAPGRYVRMDLDPDADERSVDVQASLTRLPFGDATFDLILCYHVLEHVPDDASAMAELARVLRPGGVALVQVPFRPARLTDEDPDAPEQERIERFGQADHVRYYGHDFEDRLAAAGLRGPRITPQDVLGTELVELFGVKPAESVWVLRHDGAPAWVDRREAPGNRLMAALLEVDGPAAREEVAGLQDRVEQLRAERDRLREQRDVWRARHERITGHPAVRAVAAPYRWVRRR